MRTGDRLCRCIAYIPSLDRWLTTDDWSFQKHRKRTSPDRWPETIAPTAMVRNVQKQSTSHRCVGKKHRPLIAMKIAHRQTIMLDVIAKHWPSVNTSKRLAHGLTSHLKSRKHIPIQNSEMCPMCMEDTGLPRKREPCVSWNSASSSISGGIRSRQPRPGLALQPLWVRARWAQYLKENLSGVNK